jgi:hypothetical protein
VFSGWPAIAPYSSNVQRPLSGVVCYSNFALGILMDVTSYDAAGSTAIIPLPSGSGGALLLATGFDGFAGVAGSFVSATTTAAPAADFTGASSGSHSTTTSVGGAVRNLWSLKQLGPWLIT